MNSTIAKLITANELMAMPSDGFRYELVKGELIRLSPTGHDHGVVAMNIAGPLHRHVKGNNLGAVYAAGSGFLITQNPDTVRAPDVAYVKQTRIDQAGRVRGYWIGAPDLAVEVVSRGDTIGSIEGKVAEWLAAGVRMVWVASPKLRSVTVYHSRTQIVVLTENNTIEGCEVVPGFSLRVAEIFAGI